MRLLSLLLAVICVDTALAKIIYVNNVTGSNRNRGDLKENHGAGAGPLRSISAALRRAESSDRVEIANTGRPYRECIALQGARNSGSRYAPFVVNGNGATLEGDRDHRVGITLYEVRGVVVHSLNVQGYSIDGINAHDNVFDCALVNVTCSANGRGGISVGGASRLDVVDCRAHRNGKVQLRTEGWSTTRLTRTRLVSPTTPSWIRRTSTAGKGARLIVDGAALTELQGFSTPEEWQELLADEAAAKQPPAASVPAPPEQPTADEPTTDPADVSNPFVDDDPNDNPFGNDTDAASASETTAEPETDQPATDDPFGDDIFSDEGDADDDTAPADEDDPFEF